MRKFRILALMLVLIMVLAGCGTGNSTPAAKDIVILYTNDAHCGIEDGTVSYTHLTLPTSDLV